MMYDVLGTDTAAGEAQTTKVSSPSAPAGRMVITGTARTSVTRAVRTTTTDTGTAVADTGKQDMSILSCLFCELL